MNARGFAKVAVLMGANTDRWLVPIAARHLGMSNAQLCVRILELARVE